MNYLSNSEIYKLLPISFSPFSPVKGRKTIVKSSVGNIYVSRSKYHLEDPYKDWWFDISVEALCYFDVKYICLALDFRGILLIPIKVFNDYRAFNSVGKVKGGREDFSISLIGVRYIRHYAGCSDLDLTNYFIPVK